MNASSFKKPALSAIAFFATLAVLSVGYAAYSSLSTVTTGQTITVGMWTQVKDNFDDLYSKVSNISTSGNNVWIGISPSYKLDVSIGAGNSGVIQRWSAPSYESVVLGADGSKAWIGTVSTTPFSFRTQDTERMRIDASGNVLFGTTTPIDHRVTIGGYSNAWGLGFTPVGAYLANANLYSYIIFRNGGGVSVGDISSNGTTTTYATSSDYRLKTDVKAMTGALERIMRLKPDTYRWMADGSYGEGFLAHELQEVVGIAVTGEKDGTDGAGKPKYQSVDYGKLTPVLTAGIQELKGENDIQTEKIAELETAILELRTRCGN